MIPDYHQLLARLHDFRLKQKRYAIFHGFSVWLCFAGILFAALVLFESIFWFSSPVRMILVFGAFSIGCLSGIVFIGWMLRLLMRRKDPSDETLAFRIGQHFPSVKDRLGNAIQVFKAHESLETSPSKTLAEKAFLEETHQVRFLNFDEALVKPRTRPYLVIFFILLAGMFMADDRAGHSFARAIFRLSNPATNFVRPSQWSYDVFPGNSQVVYGDSVSIGVRWQASVPEKLVLNLFEGKDEKAVSLDPKATFVKGPVYQAFSYQFVIGREKSLRYSVNVIPRPRVQSLKITVEPPAHTRLETLIQDENVGDVEAFVGSTLHFNIQSNKPLKSATLQYETGPSFPMQVDGQGANVAIRIKDDAVYYFTLFDFDSLENLQPIQYRIRTRVDQRPQVRIVRPDAHVDLDQSMRLPLKLEAVDDFGFTQHRIAYRIESSLSMDTAQAPFQYVPLQLPGGSIAHVEVDTVWSLEQIGLFPEDVLHYFYEACDNDRVSGPKWSRTMVHTVRFPSIHEILQEAANDGLRQEEDLTSVHDEVGRVRDQLQTLSDDLKTGQEMDWDQKQVMDQVVESQKKIEDAFEQIQDDLDQMIQTFEKNDLLSMETLSKYQELQSLYQEIATPEMVEAMQQWQKMMEEMSQEALAESIDQFKVSEEQLLQSIERSLNLLKRIQAEQNLDAAIQRLDQMVRDQQALNEKIRNENSDRTTTLSKMQEKLEKQFGEFEQILSELQEQMDQLPSMPTSEFQTLQQMMRQEDIPTSMRKTGQSLQQKDMNEAGKQGTRAQKSMEQVSESLKSIQKQMQMQSKTKLMADMTDLAFRLLRLSKNQEELLQKSRDGQIDVPSLMKAEHRLMTQIETSLEIIRELGKETVFLQIQLGQFLSKSYEQINTIVQELQNRKTPAQMLTREKEVMADINRAVCVLMASVEQMAQSQSGLGMEQFFQQLEQMGQEQMALNRQLMDMLQQGQLSLQDQAALQRMAARQQALKEQLEGMYRKMGQQGQRVGRMDGISKEMEEVAEELKSGNVSRKTLEKQDRILNRLLDAQRSIREQDTGRQRRARTGQDVYRKSPDAADLTPSELKKKLSRDMLDLLKEGYTKDYEALIKAYFDALMSEESSHEN